MRAFDKKDIVSYNSSYSQAKYLHSFSKTLKVSSSNIIEGHSIHVLLSQWA